MLEITHILAGIALGALAGALAGAALATLLMLRMRDQDAATIMAYVFAVPALSICLLGGAIAGGLAARAGELGGVRLALLISGAAFLVGLAGAAVRSFVTSRTPRSADGCHVEHLLSTSLRTTTAFVYERVCPEAQTRTLNVSVLPEDADELPTIPGNALVLEGMRGDRDEDLRRVEVSSGKSSDVVIVFGRTERVLSQHSRVGEFTIEFTTR